MAKNITIKVPGKHPQTGELTTFELKGQRMDIDIGGQAMPFLIHGRGIGTSLTHIPRLCSQNAGFLSTNSSRK